MKRAQTATEYLILLSVILFITGFVVSSLVDFPSLIDSVNGRSDSAYWDYSDIRIVDHTHNTTHLIMSVQNALFEPINISQMYVNLEEFNTSYYLVPGESANVLLPVPTNVSAGDRYEYTIDFTFIQGNSNVTFPGVVPIGGVVGVS